MAAAAEEYKITDDERREYLETFRLFDRDNNGVIDKH